MPRPSELPPEHQMQAKAREIGTSPIWVHKGHFIKQTESPHNAQREQLISKVFADTKTPGAHPVVARHWPEARKTFSISKYINGTPLGDMPHEWKPPKDAGDILLSELLTGTSDRHADNYLVKGNTVHSIDHESGLGHLNDSHYPSVLYQRMMSHWDTRNPQASKEHLVRWLKYAPQYRKLIAENPHLVQNSKHLDEFEDRLSKAVESVKRTGTVNLKELLPQRHRMVLHGPE